MEGRNVLLAIVLSTVVLIVWAVFFEAPIVEQKTDEKKITQNYDASSPSIDEEEKEIMEVKRSNLIDAATRIKIENENIKGSISLQRAIIDDITFKNYKKNLNSEDKIIFLNQIISLNGCLSKK